MLTNLIGAIVGAGIIRSIAGWLENSLKDAHISKYEWGQLFSTMMRLGTIAAGIYFGFGMEALPATGIAVAGDFGLQAVKKITK